MCDQMPDLLIMNGRKVHIESLPIIESEIITCVPEKSMPVTTGHIRGYIAYWELTDQRLYLIRTEGCYQLQSGIPVLADWVTGIIRPASGSYEKDFAIQFEKGEVVN